ncbi:HEAT repeat domain-containing protein [Nocardia higoensis]|uniref:HEAT repeat domain-containing protein n=1 Tax=Nocardia higoensis TaxID=228599 RepID=A0ABS0D9S6_9NOCA|nr:HEAT repeat domain-containing protein [Nocardia higoensis]MBF6353639.1 HEAT repeat domain-containing protein [Nocardia higoensis]
MHGSSEPGSAVEAVVARSRDIDTGIRVAAVQELAQWIDQPAALDRLIDMLHDQNVTVMVDAAEVLARRGGAAGIRGILEEIGRSEDDADVDYIMYKLEELEALGEAPILVVARSLDASRESVDFRAGLSEVESYMGHHNPK